MAEAMLEEDEVLIRLEARREALMEVVREDQALGRAPDRYIMDKIKNLTVQIDELRELNVL